MRTTAILASIIVGATCGFVIGALLDLAFGVEATIGTAGFFIGAITLPIVVARLVPRSPRTQARHDQAMERIGQFRR